MPFWSSVMCQTPLQILLNPTSNRPYMYLISTCPFYNLLKIDTWHKTKKRKRRRRRRRRKEAEAPIFRCTFSKFVLRSKGRNQVWGQTSFLSFSSVGINFGSLAVKEQNTGGKMSTAVGAFSPSKEIAFSNEMENEDLKKMKAAGDEEEKDQIDFHDIDEEEDDHSNLKSDQELDLGPQVSLKEQLEKDKDDESLRRWKEQLLGSLDMSALGESKQPEVKLLNLSIICPDRADLVLPLPFTTSSKKRLFTLKEGSQYRLKLSFNVSNNIVSGLKYTNTVWKTGMKVDHTKVMLGTFSPQQESYIYEMEEETTPSGIFARGSYSARTKILDDDGTCYLDASYHFEIQKNWT